MAENSVNEINERQLICESEPYSCPEKSQNNLFQTREELSV